MADNFIDIFNLYRNAPRESFGEVYICNMKGKAARRANVRLNGVNAFTVAKKPDSKNPIIPLENLNLRWLDKKTVAFNIPFGQWEIAVHEISESCPERVGSFSSYDHYSKPILFEVGPSMPKAYFKHKIGWFDPILKQIEPFGN